MSGVAVRALAADVLARLQGMEDRGQNLSGVMRNFGEYMKRSIDKNFSAEGRPAPWARLSLSTLLGWGRGKKGHITKKGAWSKKGQTALAGRKVLTDSARLRNSISYNAGAREISIGTNVIYAAIHHFGGQAGRGKKVTIPARPFMLFQDEDINYFERSLIEFILTRRLT
jgi:phage virion morphogenesis protein